MKTVILCGGRGLRLGDQTRSMPKALLEIGGRPVLWHVLKLYAHHSLNEFILCLGYLGDQIKRYFHEHHWRNPNFLLNTTAAEGEQVHDEVTEQECHLSFVETGLDTNTGGRIYRIQPYIGSDTDFCVTYCDGLADIDLRELLEFHRAHGRLATLTAVHPFSNFGLLKVDGHGAITEFLEKPKMADWANGGFFVFRRGVFDYLSSDSILEGEPLEQLALRGQLMAYRHTGFWACLDTYKDHVVLNETWERNQAQWKTW